MKSSQAAIDLIVNEEVTSKEAYQQLYTHPEWPGGASGVTIGIGYDCGYSTSDQIYDDWSPHLPVEMVEALQDVAGITGPPAHSHAHELRGTVTVPWDAAMAVFLGRDIPKWEGIVSHALPNTDKLAPDSFGALVSLSYNRGASFSSPNDRYREMRSIRQDMASMNFADIPMQFESMRRLWPNTAGLRNRRDHEAALFEKGLSE